MARSSQEKHRLSPLGCLGVLVPISGPSVSRSITLKHGFISGANDTDFSLQIYTYLGISSADLVWTTRGQVEG